MPRKVHNGPHKYRRIEMGKDKTPAYRCMLPGCLHYVTEDFIEGQRSICNRCDKPFTIGKSMLFPRKIHKPHCKDCSKPTYNRALGRIARGTAAEAIAQGHGLSDDDILSLTRETNREINQEKTGE